MASDGTQNLTPRQLKAVEAYVSCGNVTDAAQLSGVHRRTLYRWLKTDTMFQAALEVATQESLRAFSRKLVRLAEKAAQALEDALEPANDMKDRLRAADIVTSRLISFREHVDYEDRLAALERSFSHAQY